MDVERSADGTAILEMGGELGSAVVDGFLRRAGELELAARLQRDAAGDLLVPQANGKIAIIERVPAGARLDAGKQGTDAVVAFVRHGADRRAAENVLLVFG